MLGSTLPLRQVEGNVLSAARAPLKRGIEHRIAPLLDSQKDAQEGLQAISNVIIIDAVWRLVLIWIKVR
jgi:hypothetical protein